MCLGGIARLEAAWEEGPTRLGRLDDGCVVPLSFVPEARAGDHVLVHLGVPVEVLDADSAREAVGLRAEGRRLAGGSA